MSALSKTKRRELSIPGDRYTKSRSGDESIPVCDVRNNYEQFTYRHYADRKYINRLYDRLADDDEFDIKYVQRPSQDFEKDPSYTKFKVPFQMICRDRYAAATKNYEKEFKKEIKNLIDNQPTAREATYLVRIVSYTTLWPPYHNTHELFDTSRRFYALSPKEKARFNYIMSQ